MDLFLELQLCMPFLILVLGAISILLLDVVLKGKWPIGFFAIGTVVASAISLFSSILLSQVVSYLIT
jgi:hypothetical protein